MGFSQIAYPNILIRRVAMAIETGLQRLVHLAASKDDVLQERRAGNGAEQPGRCPRFAKVESPEKEILMTLLMV